MLLKHEGEFRIGFQFEHIAIDRRVAWGKQLRQGPLAPEGIGVSLINSSTSGFRSGNEWNALSQTSSSSYGLFVTHAPA